MTDIMKLAENWRDDAVEASEVGLIESGYHVAMVCATSLENALPKWTRITDDEKSRPPRFEPYLFANDDMPRPKVSGANTTLWVGDWWRPLCDLDYPPEQKP